MTVLLADFGNSRCKWGLWRAGRIHETGVLTHAEAREAGHWAFAAGIERALACSVAGDDADRAAAAAISAASGVAPEFATTAAESCGVRCGYADPARLGVDRWMAVLAVAAEATGPALVVDAGTALTIDALADRATHLGGFIVPGAALMRDALTSGTAGIRVDASVEAEARFGDSTSAAVTNGAFVALAGTVQRALALLAETARVAADTVTCRFSGGDGARLAAALGRDDDYRPHLVLEGLAAYGGLAA